MTRLNAVFEGGGVKGIAHVGAVNIFEQRGVSFQAVAGTSAGAIVAALYAAGYSADEMKVALNEKDFSELLDRFWSKTFGLWSNYGMYKGDRLYSWIYGLLEKKGVRKFQDLRGADLTIIASNLTDQEVIVFDKRNVAGMDIAEAVRMSAGIPLFFSAYKWGKKLIVDGGLLSNYPLRVFASSELPTIGFKLVQEAPSGPPRTPGSFLEFLNAMVATTVAAHDKEDQKNFHWASTVHISTGTIPSTRFSLTPEEKAFLYKSGCDAGTGFLNGPGRRFVYGVTGEEREEVERAERAVHEKFKSLPQVADTSTVSAPPPLLDLEVVSAFEDAEKTLVYADHLRLLKDNKALASYFVKLAGFRSTMKDYPKAVVHLERAIELDPDSAEAHRLLGSVLAQRAAVSDPRSKEPLLTRAEDEILRAEKILGQPSALTLHDLAWIYDERRDFDKAIVVYKKALGISQAGATEGVIRYNLACALAKLGNEDGALEELAKLPYDLRVWAETDPDFEALRGSTSRGPRFREIIRRR